MTSEKTGEKRPSWAPPVLRGDRLAAGLRTLELDVRRRLDGLLQGNHLGLVPGPGSEPGEARPYQPGDDVRRMDWAVTARTTVPHIRETVADRELETWLAVDLSPSLDFGTALCEKRDLVVCAVAAMTHLTSGGGNRIGAVVATGEKTERIPARGGLAHARSLLHQVARTPAAPLGTQGDLAALLEQLRRPPRRRGLGVVISDFLGPRDWERPLRGLSARHDLVCVEIVDPRDIDLPEVGTIVLADPETGKQREVRASPLLRREFAAAASEHRAMVAAGIRGAGAAHLVLRTDSDWIADTVRFVVARKRRWSGGAASMFGLSLSGFTTPGWFLLLLFVAALVGGYLLIQRMRRRRAMRFTNLALLDKIAPRGPGWWRHVPAAVLVVALLLLTVALAGPTAQERVPRNRATVMLVVDVSLSMECTDVTPTRLQAAQVAAKQFADGLPSGINLGLVSFAGSATVLVSPTTDHTQVDQGIDNLKLAEGTATGDAIAAALNSIENFGASVTGPDGTPPARIVLMSDGKQTLPSMDPSGVQGAYTEAKESDKKGVPISTISFGTSNGVVNIQGTEQPVPVDDDLLRQVAQLTHGDFYKAVTGDQLKQVYASLRDQIGYTTEQSDASKPWLILGTLLALVAGGASLFIGQRLPA